jgi:sodium-dependent phosphate cotransporter
MNGARLLGKATRIWRGFPFLYIALVFFLIPVIFLGLSALFEQGTKGWTTLGAFVTILLSMGLLYTGYWCRYKDGQEKLTTCFSKRQRVRETMESLPDDMEYLKAKVSSLIDHTGLPDEEEPEVEVKADDAAIDTKDDENATANDEEALEVQT